MHSAPALVDMDVLVAVARVAQARWDGPSGVSTAKHAPAKSHACRACLRAAAAHPGRIGRNAAIRSCRPWRRRPAPGRVARLRARPRRSPPWAGGATRPCCRTARRSRRASRPVHGQWRCAGAAAGPWRGPWSRCATHRRTCPAGSAPRRWRQRRSADAGARDHVDRHAQFVQHLEHTDRRRAARTAARQCTRPMRGCGDSHGDGAGTLAAAAAPVHRPLLRRLQRRTPATVPPGHAPRHGKRGKARAVHSWRARAWRSHAPTTRRDARAARVIACGALPCLMPMPSSPP